MSASSLAAPASRTGPPAGAADAGAADSGGYAGAAPVAHSTSVPINKAISSSSSVLKFCNWASDCVIYSFLANSRCNSRYRSLWFCRNCSSTFMPPIPLFPFCFGSMINLGIIISVDSSSTTGVTRKFGTRRRRRGSNCLQYLSQSDFTSAIPLYISNPRRSVLAIPSCTLLYSKTRSEIETGHLSFAPLHKKDKRSENDVWKTK